MIAATVVDPASLCADDQRRGLQRIASTLDAVPYVTMCNLANLDAALRGGLLDLIEVRLMCVGAGPTLDYADAAAFLAGFETMIEKVRSGGSIDAPRLMTRSVSMLFVVQCCHRRPAPLPDPGRPLAGGCRLAHAFFMGRCYRTLGHRQSRCTPLV